MSTLDVTVHEPDASPLQLQGPLAPRVAHKLFGDIATELGYYQFREVTLQGITFVLSRTVCTSESG